MKRHMILLAIFFTTSFVSASQVDSDVTQASSSFQNPHCVKRSDMRKVVNGVCACMMLQALKFDDNHEFYQQLQTRSHNDMVYTYTMFAQLEDDLMALDRVRLEYIFSRTITDIYAYVINRDIEFTIEPLQPGQPQALSAYEKQAILDMFKVMFQALYPEIFGGAHDATSFLTKIDAFLSTSSRATVADALRAWLMWSFDHYCREVGIEFGHVTDRAVVVK